MEPNSVQAAEASFGIFLAAVTATFLFCTVMEVSMIMVGLKGRDEKCVSARKPPS